MKWLSLLSVFLSALAPAEISYFIEPDLPAKTFRVKVTVDDPGSSPSFCIPAWCPGWYVLTSSYKKISDVKAASANGEPLGVQRRGKHEWSVANPTREGVVFSYRVLADERGLGFDYTHIDSRTAFVNGPAAFMYVKDRIREPVSLAIKAPTGWDIATPLTFSEGKHRANDYDELIDCPIQIGAMKRKSFTIDSVPFEVIYVGRTDEFRQDLDYETERIKRLTEPAMRMFGSIPCKKYMYIVHIGSGMWEGGLEHRSSTVLDVGNTVPLNIDTLVTHEFFHTWNVKSMRPKVLGPFDYTQPCRTRNLWFAEGVTDYYAYVMAYRSGVFDENWLARNLAAQAAQLYRSPSRLKINIEDASYQTWEHGGFGYKDLSFYNKGLLIGWLLDAAIIGATQGAQSLDDVMRSMYQKYRLPKPGYEEDAILKEINAIAGTDLTAIYNLTVRSTSELPYGILRDTIGLVLVQPNEPYLSVGFEEKDGKIVALDQDEHEAGLRIGDHIARIERPDAQGIYAIEIERNGESMRLQLRAERKTAQGYRVEPDPFASPQAKKNLRRWLSRQAEAVADESQSRTDRPAARHLALNR